MKNECALKFGWAGRVAIACSIIFFIFVFWLPHLWSAEALVPHLPLRFQIYIVRGLSVGAALLCICCKKGALLKCLFGMALAAYCLFLGLTWPTPFISLKLKLFNSTEQTSSDCVRVPSSSEKLFALTFDDGPIRGKTAELLDALKQENVHATFFVLGRNIAGNEDIIRRAYAEGNEIANHGWTHRYMPIHLPSTVVESFSRCNQAVETVTGKKPEHFRFPYGASTRMHLAAIRQHCHMRAVFWNNSTNDYLHDGDAKYCERVLAALPEQAPVICLCHDHGITPGGLLTLIQELKRRGYRFVTVSELVKAGAASAS